VTKSGRRLVLIIGALAVVVITLAGALLLWPDDEKPADATQTPKPTAGPSPGQVLDNFLKAAGAGSAVQAAAMTDNPAAAEAALAALAKNVPAGAMTFGRTGSASTKPDSSVTVPIKVKVALKNTNEWTSSVDLARTGDKWVVKWAPTVIHPKLAEGQSIAVLGQVVGQAGKPAVLGEDGKPIMTWQGATAAATDPKISPLLLKTLVGGGGAPGDSDSRHISIIDAAGKEVGEPLFGTAATPASTEPIKSTVNPKIAIAAQNAVAKATQETMIVAIRPSTGGILAVAQNDAAGSVPKALNGQYPPGSSFKIVTAAAAIQQQGMSLDSEVRCPGQATVGGRSLKNSDSFDLGTTKLRNAFAKSCNTTFGEIASKLPADGLKKAASQFGLNADYAIPGISTELGKVEDAGSSAQRVEDSIGQGNITASPLGMAMVAATVVAKKPVTPRLRADEKTEVTAGYSAPPAAVLSQLQTMMREVVTAGTATALAKFNAAGKTGTAETESQGDNAHGWFVGYRGDVAFAVLVVDGKSSGVAVNVAAAFLSGF
jgi:beta-lactamase class D